MPTANPMCLRSPGRQTGRGMLANCLTLLLLLVAAPPSAPASENVPHRPFAMWADVPQRGEFIAGVLYEESEAYRIWAPHEDRNVTIEAGGESYGIDVMNAYLALQYGLKEKWAADLSIGVTTMGNRSFSGDESVMDTTGLMDMSFGVRYQLFNEQEDDSRWIPTTTFRVGAVLPGTYDKDIEFAPGQRAAAIEPELLLRKHFGWPGLGAYGDFLFRWNRTTGNDLYITTIGLFQKIRGWELMAGYRHLQHINGTDLSFENPDDFSTLIYPRDPREINESIEAGFSYTTVKRKIRYGFHTRTVLAGTNSDRKFWIGGSIDIPFGRKSE